MLFFVVVARDTSVCVSGESDRNECGDVSAVSARPCPTCFTDFSFLSGVNGVAKCSLGEVSEAAFLYQAFARQYGTIRPAAIRTLIGAEHHEVVVSRDRDAMKAHSGSFDFILNTVAAARWFVATSDGFAGSLVADPAAALAEIESEAEDYRKIAERRVRLGLQPKAELHLGRALAGLRRRAGSGQRAAATGVHGDADVPAVAGDRRRDRSDAGDAIQPGLDAQSGRPLGDGDGDARLGGDRGPGRSVGAHRCDRRPVGRDHPRRGRVDDDAAAAVATMTARFRRGDLTVEYRGKSDFEALDWVDSTVTGLTTNDFRAKKSEWLIMANAYADLGTFYSVTPYLGAGIGASKGIAALFSGPSGTGKLVPSRRG